MADATPKQKLRLDLISPHALAKVALAMTVGSEKHGPTNYIDKPRVDEEQKQMASLLRHLNADRCGMAMDVECSDTFFRKTYALSGHRRAYSRIPEPAPKK